MNAQDAIELLFTEGPLFHKVQGEQVTWNSQRKVLEFIAEILGPGKVSLETGCGYSTVVSIASGAQHTCVTPSQEESNLVMEFCARHSITVDKATFAIGFSQDMLPGLAEAGELDYVYIDGAHRFPYPCIDWVYTEKRLKDGGVILVDDVRIPSCRVLHEFLVREENWVLEKYIGDTSVFEKTGPSDYSRDWVVQSYNKSYPDFSFFPINRRIPAEFNRIVTGVRNRLARMRKGA